MIRWRVWFNKEASMEIWMDVKKSLEELRDEISKDKLLNKFEFGEFDFYPNDGKEEN